MLTGDISSSQLSAGYWLQAAKDREAEAALNPSTLPREATREPGGRYTRGKGESGGRPFRESKGSIRRFGRDSSGWLEP